jgi:hypothetical protein
MPCRHWRKARSRFLNIDPEVNCLVQAPDKINVSNVQACCRPALAIFCEAVVRVCGTLTLHARYAP